MEWIENYDLFLFDFDGLLVDTEGLHYEAYSRVCTLHGVVIPWNFEQYCSVAHSDHKGIERGFYAHFPQFSNIPWSSFYAEKKDFYLKILAEARLACLPGVEELLSALQTKNKRRCVVTHSPKVQIETIKKALPILQTIPNWLTREDYSQPKPNSECYLKAIALWGESGDRIIGFEDSYRGLTALQGSGARSVLVCPKNHPQMKGLSLKEVSHFETVAGISGL